MQIVNCHGDAQLQEDVENGWKRIIHDFPPDNAPFTDTPGLNFDTNSAYAESS